MIRLGKPGLLTLASAAVSRGGYLVTFLYLHARLGGAGATAIVIASSAASLQVLGDPGLGLLLAARRELAISRGTLLRAGLVQFAVAVAASAVAVLISAGQWQHVEGATRLLVTALLVIAVLECTSRVLRSPTLHCGQWGRYVAPEFGFALSRVLIIGLIPVSGVVGASSVAIGMCLASAAVLATVYVHAAQPRPGPGYGKLLRMALPVGASTTLAAGYSQVQVPLIGWLASGGAASSYALAIRVVQATEIIPSSLCQIQLPGLERTRSTRQVERSLQRQLAVYGGVLAVGLVVGPLALRHWFDSDLTLVLIPILALSVPIKFVNYANASALVAYGRATDRLKASGIVAGVGLPLLALAAATGPTVLGVATVALEAVLLGMFFLALRREGGGDAAAGVQRAPVERQRVPR